MRLLYVLIAAAASLLANIEATTSADSAKMISVQVSKTTRRFLRSPKPYENNEEERAPTNILTLVDDAAKALPSADEAAKVLPTLDDLFRIQKMDEAPNTKKAMEIVKPLFDKMSSYPKIKEAALKEMETNQNLKSLWSHFILSKRVNFDVKEISKQRPSAS
ncbi:secreted RxLR effector peptide protein, putative [Phytophthora infestans T30-4]|uniref:RxLR effector protein n=1 Tax=Phytophthora infestans (strain T30-4) TaxID=403677 RepID=D0MRN8_PHYIT|nr:secreted RxLR effector peptide protein, putative [Phytophthora infestans T30-4]EEY58157.1 secreted RxLR effector peptide protein, putative [Phytophthora infestans T30-4]KAI9989952.1 hypothetical protein PInf_020257 [Phytophthora infestans]|eukprot:XP_002909343.1 secreted RxLR effector peptide protein, putative [Phytophthora infestans T30-4]